MNDRFTPNENLEKAMEEQLKFIAEHTDASQTFKSELEQRLMSAHQTQSSSIMPFFKQTLPMISWAVGLAVLALFLNWAIRGIVRTPPAPAAEITTTPTIAVTLTPESIDQVGTPTGSEGYDWRDTKLYLVQPLPESPAEANVYQLRKDQQVTPEEARALASRFGLQGEMYTAYDYMFSINDYYFTDGKKALEVYSNRRFIYTADLAKARKVPPFTPSNNAEEIIQDFLRARGFDFPFKITPSDFFGGYNLEPMTPDGLTIQYESFTFPPMLIRLDENGEVLSIDATLVDYDPTPLGTYRIISAEEALDILLDDNAPGGKIDFFHSASNQWPKEWFRSYSENQTVTVHGYVSSNPAADTSRPPFITIDGVPAVGNTAGLEELDPSSFIEATGQYRIENGLRHFNVESWKANIVEDYVMGTLRREADQIILTNEDGSGREYPIIDPPTDLPLDTDTSVSQLSVSGVIVDGKMDWTYIQFFEDTSHMGGGGGGGGLGFYQLNLSGTSIPFPTPTAQSISIQGAIEYVVKEGDTIFAIAESYGVTPDEIVQANDWLTEEHTLIPGKTLIIPAELTTRQYIVQANDTLASIALNHGVTVDQLVQANNLPDADLVYTGQVLLIPRLQSSSEERVEDLRGFLSISIHKLADGSQKPSHIFSVSDSNSDTYYELEGSNLSELNPYNGLPIIISGTIKHGDAYISTLSLESYEIPFPDLKFQILKGTQQVHEIDGQIATLFTTEDGQTYVEFQTNTGQLNFSIIGNEGDLVQQEVLIVPDETFSAYPVIRVYSAGLVISPKDGQPMDLPITADEIPVFDAAESPEVPNTPPPSLTIDNIELKYFVNNPYYQVNDPNYERRSTYIQPVWHFRGHYENGDKFDMLVQALKQEFLSPQLSPGITPG